jgi:hypothetical protein
MAMMPAKMDRARVLAVIAVAERSEGAGAEKN